MKHMPYRSLGYPVGLALPDFRRRRAGPPPFVPTVVTGLGCQDINPSYGVGRLTGTDGIYGESWDEPGDGGARMTWPKASIVVGGRYRFEAVVSRASDDATLGLMIDVCDDETVIGIQGPFYLHSMINFEFDAPASVMVDKWFIDCWCADLSAYNYGEFGLANIALTRIA